MFLRTKCDRELYLSLHEDSELEANGMPVPLQARPGIGVLQTVGRDFEDDRNEQLIQAFYSLVIYQPDKGVANYSCPPKCFVVGQKTLNDEWAALEGLCLKFRRLLLNPGFNNRDIFKLYLIRKSSCKSLQWSFNFCLCA